MKKCLFYGLCLCALFASCSNHDVDCKKSGSNITKEASIDYDLLSKELYYPVDELLKMNRQELDTFQASWIIEQHTHLDGLKYIIDISKTEAEKLGVSREIYQNIREQFDELTRLYEDAERRGGHGKPFDPQLYVKKRKAQFQSINHFQPVSRSEYDNYTSGILGSSLGIPVTASTYSVAGFKYIHTKCGYELPLPNNQYVYVEIQVTIGNNVIIQYGGVKQYAPIEHTFKPDNNNNGKDLPIKIIFASNNTSVIF